MIKKLSGLAVLLITLFSFSGCNNIGEKTASLNIVYIATSVLALLLLAGYCFLIRKKDNWFLLLFSSVFIVNAGYLSLSISGNLEEALLANRISYLGSVFLPLAMFMIILNTCKIEYKKWLPFPLILISSVVFIIAASPVYLDIYYKSVSLKTVNGVSVLDKAYGSWHCIYLYYLIGYFLAMIAVIVFSCMKKKINSPIHASIIATAVFVNIGVWLFEQFVKVDLEFLSISYIISEIFLLMLNLLIQEHTENHIPAIAEPKIIPVVAVEKTPEFKPEIKMPTEEAVSTDEIILTEQEVSADEEFSLKCEYFKSRLYTLTPTEKEIYSLYLKGNRTKDIMESLNIKENTIKYHNKNIYSKLGVSSRKELLKIANCIVVEA